MTHRYTILVQGTVIPGHDETAVSAIAWAEDTVIALGTDDDVRSASRGDSHVIDLRGATVVPLGDGLDVCWPVDATLEVGGRANLAVLDEDPRQAEAPTGPRLPARAVVRGGRVVAGWLPGGDAAGDRHRGHARDGYYDQSGREDILSGGVKLIPISTLKGGFRVWTKRTGNNPRVKVLLLHGGPGATHEYFEACDSYFPAAGIEYYYYDQLGSAYSDQPDDPDLWETPRFVEEVEQVRQALGLDRGNFYLLGHSWGGILAIEYALKYQRHLKALVISNMMSSIPAYNAYAERVLMPAMDQDALAEIKGLEAAKAFDDPRYMALLLEHHYVHHVLRMPPEDWPDPVNRAFAHINQAIYVPMQGPSELGASGKLVAWDRTADLSTISVPTLVIGARHDTMDPRYLEMMATRFQRGTYLFCPKGSHMAMYDDQVAYFAGIVDFIRNV